MNSKINPEIEYMSVTQLNELGNQAIQLGLIAGHGHHGGQYEIIRQGKIITLTPQEALTYLQELIHSATETE
ncbi:MAG: hypothetical protein AAF152_14740 [Cyanobacteria bacterium P01_A01_bin.114]